MNKVFWALFFALIFTINASALSVEIKDSYERQETMIIKISGDIKEPITKDNILLKRVNVVVPFDYDIRRLGADYYIWGIAPLNQNNYTLWLNDITSTVEGKLNKSNYMCDFKVSENLVDYYIKPAVIYTDSDFEISAYNNKDLPEEISTNFPEQRNIILEPGENKIEFTIADVVDTEQINFSFGKYDVKAYIIGKEDINTSSNETNVSEVNVYFVPQKISREIFAGELETYPITITNEGGDLENISLEYNKSIFIIVPELPGRLESGKSIVFNLSSRTNNDIDEDVILIADGTRRYLNVKLTISEISQNNTGKSAGGAGFYCDELGGNICKSGESCSADTISSLDGECCLGTCAASEGSSFAWIGYLIAAIVIIGIIFIYYKYKSVKSDKNPLAKRVAGIEKKNLP